MTSSTLSLPRWMRFFAILGGFWMVAEQLASAEIVLDTYDVPVEMRTTNRGGLREIVQSDFSDMVEERSTVVQWWSGGEASFTVNVDEPSLAVMQLDLEPRFPSQAVTNAFAFGYSLRDHTDMTEGGRNNAFLIDFARYGGPTPPRTLRMIVTSPTRPTTLAYAYSFDIPPSDEPFTWAVPFDEFALRAGVGRPDFTRIGYVGIELNGSGVWHRYKEEGFDVAIDTLRVGRIVPEPLHGAWSLWLLVILARRSLARCTR